MNFSTLGRCLLIVAALASPRAAAQTVAQVLDPGNCKLFTAATASADHNSTDVGATTYSKPVDIGKFNRMSVSVKWVALTGSVDATVKIQVATAPYPASTDWVDKASANFTLSGTDSVNSISMTNLTERWARVVYSANSVSGGTITGYCSAKSI